MHEDIVHYTSDWGKLLINHFRDLKVGLYFGNGKRLDEYYLYGFQQIETPSREMLSTLMGKYGDEGDKLLFKMQNSGDYFSGITDEELLSRNAVKLASKFCEKGLRLSLIHI